MENLQQVVLLVDEMIDEGIIINTDGENIENKIFFKEGQTGTTQETGSYLNVKKAVYLDVLFSKIHDFQETEYLKEINKNPIIFFYTIIYHPHFYYSQSILITYLNYYFSLLHH
jgi:hypothetical protein